MSLTILANAQNVVSGTVVDSKDGQPLIGAAVTLTTTSGQNAAGQISDLDGKFSIKVEKGTYTFKIAYVGYQTHEKSVTIDGNKAMGTIRLKSENKELEEVQVTSTLVRQEQRGDTTVFNAEAFKVNPDASTEDLLKKMPGMTVEGNTVKSGGEEVKKVLVDGKEFFGDDPMIALKNISADMVSKIEVYDKASDQSEFTGFSDGNEERTINILTKMGIQSGYFGKVFGGYGTDDRFELGGNLSYFRGDHRVTLLGSFNNINQTNFGTDDSSSSGGGGFGGGFGGGTFGFGGGNSSGPDNRNASVGFNYSFEKKDKIEITLSYFYNNRKTSAESTTLQEYFEDEEHTYNSNSNNDSRNYNHRANMRLVWTINKYNSIIFRPSLTWTDSKTDRLSQGWDLQADTAYQRTLSQSKGESNSIQGQGDILWRHKFDTAHRTLSLRLNFNASDSDSDSESLSERENDSIPSQNLFTSQLTDNESNNHTLSASAQYTEPIGDHMALQVNYSPSFQFRDGDKVVEADTIQSLDEEYGNYTFSPALSSKMSSDYTIHKGGIALNLFIEKTLNASIGIDYQNASLSADREYPEEVSTKTTFNSFMPSVNVRYRKGQELNGRLRYNTRTSAPSISDMQEIIDVSNTRSYSMGNADLKQQYTHNINLFLSKNNMQTSRFIFLMFSYSYTLDYIANSTLLYSDRDTVLTFASGKQLELPQSVEFNQPVNRDGQYSLNAHVTYSTPVQFIRSTANISLGANLSSSPVVYNNVDGTNDSYVFSGGLSVASNISENVDFTIGYNGSYTMRENSFSTDRNSYSHSISADVNTLFFQQRLVFTNHVANEKTSGLGNGYDSDYILWNTSLGFKFLKTRNAELRFKVNDALNKSRSVNQSNQQAYTQTTRQEVLGRYMLLTFSLKLRKMGNIDESKVRGGFGPGAGGPPPGGMPGGGPGGPR